LIFGTALAVIALFHRAALAAAVGGLAATVVWKFIVLGAADGSLWLIHLLGHDWRALTNLFLLILGFTVLADHFERSAIPHLIPAFLPANWTGGIVLLALIFVMSIFLDNIAAAIIGGVMAKHVFEGRVGTGYLAAIVAASNAGGAGSVLGDTTTTMLWINGIPALTVSSAFIAALGAFLVFAPVAALQQDRISKIAPRVPVPPPVDWPRLIIVLIFLATILTINAAGNAIAPSAMQIGPWLGIGLWLAIIATAPWRAPNWTMLPGAAKGAIFLTCLVATAAMMPVERLPVPSWQSTLGLGFLSAVFDNIPLTALALRQGGYDWGLLAYAVGFGGSMVWFGSSAGVALSNLYPEVRSVGRWLRFGWIVTVAYVVGFFALLVLSGGEREARLSNHTVGVPMKRDFAFFVMIALLLGAVLVGLLHARHIL
jgi:Na+/H+ antiporter NhaD/arsenite permease-like protein